MPKIKISKLTIILLLLAVSFGVSSVLAQNQNLVQAQSTVTNNNVGGSTTDNYFVAPTGTGVSGPCQEINGLNLASANNIQKAKFNNARCVERNRPDTAGALCPNNFNLNHITYATSGSAADFPNLNSNEGFCPSGYECRYCMDINFNPNQAATTSNTPNPTTPTPTATPQPQIPVTGAKENLMIIIGVGVAILAFGGIQNWRKNQSS